MPADEPVDEITVAWNLARRAAAYGALGTDQLGIQPYYGVPAYIATLRDSEVPQDAALVVGRQLLADDLSAELAATAERMAETASCNDIAPAYTIGATSNAVRQLQREHEYRQEIERDYQTPAGRESHRPIRRPRAEPVTQEGRIAMMPKILRGRATAETAAPTVPLATELGPDVLTLTDREMSRRFEAGEAQFFFGDIAHLAGAWWQYHHDKHLWARVTLPNLASYLDERRPEFVLSDQNHARRREIRRAAKRTRTRERRLLADCQVHPQVW